MDRQHIRGIVREVIEEERHGKHSARSGLHSEPLVVPVRVTSSDDVQRLLDVIGLIARSDVLRHLITEGLLRFQLHSGGDTSVLDDTGVLDSAEKAHATDRAGHDCHPVIHLDGIVTEKALKNCDNKSVELAAGAVLTPLARDYIRSRGIEIHRSGE